MLDGRRAAVLDFTGTGLDVDEKRVPLYLVVARIVAVSGIGFASAFALFLFVAGVWQLGLVALAITALFVFLMFLIERQPAEEKER
ncbi:MAG: hypothetical protein HYS09_02505 [Chloroflexi bacterium]|nr:hypothetical protein [Chloroflexota bacterium]